MFQLLIKGMGNCIRPSELLGKADVLCWGFCSSNTEQGHVSLYRDSLEPGLRTANENITGFHLLSGPTYWIPVTYFLPTLSSSGSPHRWAPKQLSFLGESNFSFTLKSQPQEPATLFTILTLVVPLVLISKSLALCAFQVSLWLNVLLESNCQAVNLCSG